MRNYTHFRAKERKRLYVFLDMKLPITEISRRLCKHRSSIYREISRNKDKNHYLPGIAHHKTFARKQLRPCKIATNQRLHDYIYRHLKRGWSPEQISGRLKKLDTPYYVCHETIYRFIYKMRRREWYRYLHNQKRSRGRMYGRKPKNCRYADIKLINHRPGKINQRKEPSHWEADTIVFGNKKQTNITTMLERKTRYIVLRKNRDKKSKTTIDSIKKIIEESSKPIWKSITFDQGSEFANYRDIDRHTRCQTYFCEARSPWQKGSNENFNGRLRRYLPSTTRIDRIKQEELDELALKMNKTPRKCLGYMTPKEAFSLAFRGYCCT